MPMAQHNTLKVPPDNVSMPHYCNRRWARPSLQSKDSHQASNCGCQHRSEPDKSLYDLECVGWLSSERKNKELGIHERKGF